MSYRQVLFISFLAFCIIVAVSYTRTGAGKERKEDFGNDTCHITPVNLPVNIVPGFSFPLDSNQVYQWINDHYDSAKIYQHAWGIRAGLTAQSGEVLAGDSLLVYQTWYGPEDITNAIDNSSKGGKTGFKKTNRTILQIPKQFIRTGLVQTTKVTLPGGKGLHKLSVDKLVSMRSRMVLSTAADTFPVIEGIAYNPPSADYLVSRSLFKLSVLDSLRKSNAISAIPPFPNSAINLKPTYFIAHTSIERYIKILVWQGVPPRKIFPDTVAQYNSYVFVDAMNRQQSGKALVPVAGNQPRTAAATCNLTDFIHFKIDARMASLLVGQGINASVGDVALLVAMHVATKEISNWTWQSFYWAPNPGEPFAPSSRMADSLKPSAYLTGAASHYAVGAAYAMVLPNQPIDGGTNTGVSPMFGYNPYLEGNITGLPSKLNSSFTYGVQSNCMSCHAQATLSGSLGYDADEYVSMSDTMFKNDVQLDFSWSIQENIDSTNTNKSKKRNDR